MSPSDRYTRTAVALHWLVAVLVICQFAWGWWMQEIPKQPPGMRADAFNLHKSVGLVLLALMLVRLGWRIAHPAPPLPAMPAWEARLAKATHVLLYVALIAMPVSGYLGSVLLPGQVVRGDVAGVGVEGSRDQRLDECNTPHDELGARSRHGVALRRGAQACDRTRWRDVADDFRPETRRDTFAAQPSVAA